MAIVQDYYPDERCYYCGRKVYPTTLAGDSMRCFDHIIPKCRGGKDIPENLVVACQACNLDKGQLTMDEFRAAVAFRLKVIKLPRFLFYGEDGRTKVFCRSRTT